MTKSVTVHLATLSPGDPFLLPHCGRSGVVVGHGAGSSIVDLNREEVKTFTPSTGRNKGNEVTISRTTERLHVSLETEVVPC